ncbi:MerR family transcriptional regulator [Legionella taurinensis]|uniref:MerR family transcriptional regulator n=1 Tax=Legionella taurinensis TaxID=70611 RepID=UPI0026BC7E7A
MFNDKILMVTGGTGSFGHAVLRAWGAMTGTISKVAKELDINVETIRFYERRGLIKQPSKPEIGYRHYPKEIVNRIRFIKRSQELGFTLDEIANLLNLNDRPCSLVQQLAEHKLIAVSGKNG